MGEWLWGSRSQFSALPGRRHETETVPRASAAMLATFACSAWARAGAGKREELSRAKRTANERTASSLAPACGKRPLPAVVPADPLPTRAAHTESVGSLARAARIHYAPYMLFLVIERFREGSLRLVGERFRAQGRMMPDDVTYHASWVDLTGVRCFQLMEAPRPDSLTAWVRGWEDLVDFEIVPVLTSSEFWAQPRGG
jgi:hypothetical protein